MPIFIKQEERHEMILKDYSTGNYSVTIWKQNENPSARAALIATKWSSLLRRPSRRKSTFRYHTSCCQSTVSNFCKGQGLWVALSNWVVLGEKRIFFWSNVTGCQYVTNEDWHWFPQELKVIRVERIQDNVLFQWNCFEEFLH